MKPHYFNQKVPDKDDYILEMAKGQGYVPQTCLLGGETVIGIVYLGKDPCIGCNADRFKCKGRKA